MVVDCLWLLSVCGCCLLVVVGVCWLLLVSVGCCWWGSAAQRSCGKCLIYDMGTVLVFVVSVCY